ncbi:MAG: hypothetical protein IIA35_07600 [Proteobacteria bacterium]|nr:hypothetical protein [Pseudomonadota bacterium]
MNDVWNLPEDGEEELPENEESPEKASERERFLPSEQRSAVDSTRRADQITPPKRGTLRGRGKAPGTPAPVRKKAPEHNIRPHLLDIRLHH